MRDIEDIVGRMLSDREATISLTEYRVLVSRAACLKMIADSIQQNIDSGKTYGIVDDDLVRLLTGTANYHGKDTTEESEG